MAEGAGRAAMQEAQQVHLQGSCRAALGKRAAELLVAQAAQQGAQRAAVHAAPDPK